MTEKNMGEISSAVEKSKKAVVLGLGISNFPLVKILAEMDCAVTVCDKKTRNNISCADELEAMGVELSLGDDYLAPLDTCRDAVIFRSPGIRPDLPRIRRAMENGCFLSSEMEWFFELCPAKIFGITGSDGKTTTTTLIYKLLDAECASKGYGRVYVGGNIGSPLLPYVSKMTVKDFVVVELSSFQLMTMKKSPHVSVVTNITPNHLNWHTDMQEYKDAKLNICRSGECGRLITNADCPETAGLSISAGDTFLFSRTADPGTDNCVFLRGDIVILRHDGQETEMLKTSDILIPGMHNVENYMTAIAATCGLVSKDSILSLARTFPGVEHRCEFVRELDGVKYYNSSIDSTPTRTAAALSSFNQKVIVMICGRDKHLALEPLAKTLCERAKAVILTGEATDKVLEALESYDGYSPASLPVIVRDRFEDAVFAARDAAVPGDIVILSPAFTSFDRFNNFEERGRLFKDTVNKF